MKNDNITTVKIDKKLYESFKKENVGTKFYLQDLVNRCMYLFLNDTQFHDRISNFIVPVLSSTPQSNTNSLTTKVAFDSGSAFSFTK